MLPFSHTPPKLKETKHQVWMLFGLVGGMHLRIPSCRIDWNHWASPSSAPLLLLCQCWVTRLLCLGLCRRPSLATMNFLWADVMDSEKGRACFVAKFNFAVGWCWKTHRITSWNIKPERWGQHPGANSWSSFHSMEWWGSASWSGARWYHSRGDATWLGVPEPQPRHIQGN